MTAAPRTQPTPRKRKRATPRDADVIRRYNYELSVSPWGAKSRTATFYGCSHTHVSDVLKAAGIVIPRKRKAPEPELPIPEAYEPLDPQFEAERDAENARFAEQQRLQQLEPATPQVDVTPPVSVEPPLQIAEQPAIATYSVRRVRPPYPIVSNKPKRRPMSDELKRDLLSVGFILYAVALCAALWRVNYPPLAITMTALGVVAVGVLVWSRWRWEWRW